MVCWESWTLDVTVASPRTESGMTPTANAGHPGILTAAERSKVRRAMETTLLKSVMKVVTIMSRERDHIPPITVSETNPFPYTISVNPKVDGWGTRMGIF